MIFNGVGRALAKVQREINREVRREQEQILTHDHSYLAWVVVVEVVQQILQSQKVINLHDDRRPKPPFAKPETSANKAVENRPDIQYASISHLASVAGVEASEYCQAYLRFDEREKNNKIYTKIFFV